MTKRRVNRSKSVAKQRSDETRFREAVDKAVEERLELKKIDDYKAVHQATIQINSTCNESRDCIAATLKKFNAEASNLTDAMSTELTAERQKECKQVINAMRETITDFMEMRRLRREHWKSVVQGMFNHACRTMFDLYRNTLGLENRREREESDTIDGLVSEQSAIIDTYNKKLLTDQKAIAEAKRTRALERGEQMREKMNRRNYS